MSSLNQITVAQGLEEMQVQSKKEVYTILERGLKIFDFGETCICGNI